MSIKSKSDHIYLDLKKRIYSEEFDHYQILPTEKELELAYNASRNTVRKAIRLLNIEGLVYSKTGSSNVVLRRVPITDELISTGNVMRPSKIKHNDIETVVLSFNQSTVNAKLANKSTFDEGESVFHTVRLRIIGGKPMMIDDSYFREEIVSGLNQKIASQSIYEYIQKTLGLKIIGSKMADRVVKAEKMDRDNLVLGDKNCIAQTQNWAYIDSGEIFEYTEIHFSPEFYVRTRFVPR